MLSYELAKKLKEAGFSQEGKGDLAAMIGDLNFFAVLPGDPVGTAQEDSVYIPTLSELIEACGKEFAGLHRVRHLDRWLAVRDTDGGMKQFLAGDGSTPEEAVSRLYLALHAKN